MDRNRLILIAACLLGALAAGALAFRAGVFDGGPAVQRQGEGQAAVGGPFALTDTAGRPVGDEVLEGRWSAVFFGFTYCPDVCPATLQTLGAAADLLGPRAKDLQVVFISVDPARDTPGQMKAYIEAQDLPVRTLGLTGTPEQVAGAARAYKAYYAQEGEGPDYLVNHSTAVYLMDPKGRFDRVLAYGLTPEQMADQIGRAMRGE